MNPKKIRHEEPKFKCDLCDYTSYTKHPFEIHMRKHYGEKPFKCDKCDFATHSDSNLQSHKRNRHLEKPFKCEFCDYGAVKDSDLQRHMRQFHTMERPFKCDQCDYAGSSSITLRRHKVCSIHYVFCISSSPWFILANACNGKKIHLYCLFESLQNKCLSQWTQKDTFRPKTVRLRVL